MDKRERTETHFLGSFFNNLTNYTKNKKKFNRNSINEVYANVSTMAEVISFLIGILRQKYTYQEISNLLNLKNKSISYLLHKKKWFFSKDLKKPDEILKKLMEILRDFNH